MAEKENKSGASMEAPDLTKHLEQIADIMLKKAKGEAIGGTPFVPLSAEEVAKLPKQTQEDKAEEYWVNQDLNSYPHEGIFVSSDLQIFTKSVHGENALLNHIQDNKGITAKYFQKPK